MRRVIQYSTGNVGPHALRMLIERDDVELVGLHATSPDKIGRDAAELCGLDKPAGVKATDDVGALLALNADCVVYTSQAETRPKEALAEITCFLRSGTNVVGGRIDHNEGGVIATAARVVNAIDAVCRAPSGIPAAHDLRPRDQLRGVMW
jgi:hypothetical protein